MERKYKDITNLTDDLVEAVETDAPTSTEVGRLWQASRGSYTQEVPPPADFDFDKRPIDLMIPRVAAYQKQIGKQRKASIYTGLAAAAVLLAVLLLQGPANPVRELKSGNVYTTKGPEVLAGKGANQVFVEQGNLYWFKAKTGTTIVQSSSPLKAWLKLPQKVKLQVRHQFLTINVTGTEFQLKLGEFGGEVLLREGSLHIVHPAGNQFTVEAVKHIRFDKNSVEIIDPGSKTWPDKLWQKKWPELAPGAEVILKEAASILPEELPAYVLPPAAFTKPEPDVPPQSKQKQPTTESNPPVIKTPILKENKIDAKVKNEFGVGTLFRFELSNAMSGDKVIYGSVKKMSGSSWMIETIDGEITYIEKSNLQSWKKVQ